MRQCVYKDLGTQYNLQTNVPHIPEKKSKKASSILSDL